MKRDQMIVDFRSLEANNDNWQNLLAKMLVFVRECELIRDWGGFGLANAAFRNLHVSIDQRGYDDHQFDNIPEFAETMNGSEVLIFSISLNDYRPTESGADLFNIYFALTKDLKNLDSMIM